MTGFVQRLKQHKLVQWAIAYVAFAFALIQVVDVVADSYHWPDAAMHLAFGVLVLGFVVVLVLAWYHGERGAQRVSGPELLLIALALVIGGGLLWHFARSAASPRVATAAVSTRGANPAAAIGRASSVETQSANAIAAQPAPAKSIAVLPLFNLGGNPKADYLGAGISEEILNALSKLQSLTVIGRASSFQFRARDVNAAKVGRALNVRNLLSGTVQRAGEELRINIELVDTTNGQLLWSQKYDRRFKNLFALEDDISGAVIKALAVKLGAAAGQPLVVAGTASPHAHDLYMRAEQMSSHSDEASLNQSVALFNQAIVEDPNYAEAWAGLTLSYIHLADAYRAPIDLLPAMQGAAKKAVALDSHLAEGHAVLGGVLFSYLRDFPAARPELKRALVLNPGSVDAHEAFGIYLLYAERNPVAARVQFQAAEKLDPLNPWSFFWESWAAGAEGDFAGARTFAQRVLRIDPKFDYFGDPLVYVYAAHGRWQACVDRARDVQAATGDLPDYTAAVCYAHGDAMARARAVAILRQLESAARIRYVDASHIAAIRAALGDTDGAFAALEQAYRDRSAPLLGLWFLPWFNALHDDPRYHALLDKIYASNKLPADNAAP